MNALENPYGYCRKKSVSLRSNIDNAITYARKLLDEKRGDGVNLALDPRIKSSRSDSEHLALIPSAYRHDLDDLDILANDAVHDSYAGFTVFELSAT